MAASPEECAARVLEVVPVVMSAIRAEVRSRRAADVSVAQFRALACIGHRDGASLSDIAVHLDLTLPSMSKTVDGLVSRNLVKRETDARDRRRVTLSLTGPGQALHKSARGAIQRFLAGKLSALPPAERGDIAQAMIFLRPLFSFGGERGAAHARGADAHP